MAQDHINHKIAPVKLRLLAFLENILIFLLFVPIFSVLIFLITHLISPTSNLIYFLLSTALPIFIYGVVQCYLLATRGQSIGKIHLGIKVVNYKDGGEGKFYRNVFLREIFFRLLLLAGFGLVHIIDIILLLANKKHRALHDMISGTIVVSYQNNEEGNSNDVLVISKKIIKTFFKYLTIALPSMVLLFYAILPIIISRRSETYDIFSWPTFIDATILFRFSEKCDQDFLQCFYFKPLDNIYNNHIIIFHFVSLLVLAVIVQLLIIWFINKKGTHKIIN